MGLLDRFGPLLGAGPLVSAATGLAVAVDQADAVAFANIVAIGARRVADRKPPTSTEYGVATRVYGVAGLVVTHRFHDGANADRFAASFAPGSATVCRFADGRWREIATR